jgi:hypothetical protein
VIFRAALLARAVKNLPKGALALRATPSTSLLENGVGIDASTQEKHTHVGELEELNEEKLLLVVVLAVIDVVDIELLSEWLGAVLVAEGVFMVGLLLALSRFALAARGFIRQFHL